MSGSNTQSYDALLAFARQGLVRALDGVLPMPMTIDIDSAAAGLPATHLAKCQVGPPYDVVFPEGSSDIALHLSLTVELRAAGILLCRFTGGRIVLSAQPQVAANLQPVLVTSDSRAADGMLGTGSGTACGVPNVAALLAEITRRVRAPLATIALFPPNPLPENPQPGDIRRLDFVRSREGAVPSLLLGVIACDPEDSPPPPAGGPTRSFLESGPEAGVLIDNGFYLKCVIATALEAEFPGAVFNYSPNPPTIVGEEVLQDGNFRITRYEVAIDGEKGSLETRISFSDHGTVKLVVPWNAQGSLAISTVTTCTATALILEIEIDPEIEIDIDWIWAVVAVVIGAIVGLIVGGVVGFFAGGLKAGLAIGAAAGAVLGLLLKDRLAEWFLEGGIEDTVRAAVREATAPLKEIGPLRLPFPQGTEGLLRDHCKLDDWLHSGRLAVRDTTPLACEGIVHLRPGFRLDLDTGQIRAGGPASSGATHGRFATEALAGHSDTVSVEPGGIVYDLELAAPDRPEFAFAAVTVRALGGTGLSLPQEHYDDLTLGDLANLPYSLGQVVATPPEPGFIAFSPMLAGGPPPDNGGGNGPVDLDLLSGGEFALPDPEPPLVGGTTFAARTSAGRLAKCQLVAEPGGSARLRFRTYQLALPSVTIEETLTPTATHFDDRRPSILGIVRLAHHARYRAAAVNLIHPAEFAWSLGGVPIGPGTSTITVAGGPLEVTAEGPSLSFDTAPGRSLAAILRVGIVDSAGRQLDAARPIRIEGSKRLDQWVMAALEAPGEVPVEVEVNGVRKPTRAGAAPVTPGTRRPARISIRTSRRAEEAVPRTERDLLVAALRRGGHDV